MKQARRPNSSNRVLSIGGAKRARLHLATILIPRLVASPLH
jgi:hypothetical protein